MTTEEKLSKLEEVVLSDAKAEADRLRRKTDEQVEAQIASASEETEKLEEDRLRRSLAAVDSQTSRALSMCIWDAKRKVIEERDRLADRIFDEISEKLCEFTKTPDYPAYLSSLLDKYKNILLAGRCLVLARNEDVPLLTEMLREKGHDDVVTKEPGIRLGGFRISLAGRLIDETLDEKLARQREEFVCTSGFIID